MPEGTHSRVIAVLVALTVISMLSCRTSKDSAAPISPVDQFITPVPAIDPTPIEIPTVRPTLVLSLPDPKRIVERFSPKSSAPDIHLAVVTPTPLATPNETIVDSLTKFSVSVDDKKRPLLHYKFRQPMSQPIQGTGVDRTPD